jgi:hypothetical protein
VGKRVFNGSGFLPVFQQLHYMLFFSLRYRDGKTTFQYQHAAICLVVKFNFIGVGKKGMVCTNETEWL